MRNLLRKIYLKATASSQATCSNPDLSLSPNTVDFKGVPLVFASSSGMERWRIKTIYVKEPETINWIRDLVGEGDVFYDIGANIGIYSLLAAVSVGRHGHVYSFEPHAFNFTRLVTNISANNLNEIITPLSCAIGRDVCLLDFNYKSLEPGAADSQLGTLMDMNAEIFNPEFIEAKACETIDHLVFGYGLKAPTHIKIDVDGNELDILRGMEECLVVHKPKSVQVEINKRYKADLFGFMHQCGYQEVLKGYTMNGHERIHAGEDPDLIAYNSLLVPTND
jgi:FkbM family methyltransferase